MPTRTLAARRLQPADESWALALLTAAYAPEPLLAPPGGPAARRGWLRLLLGHVLRAGCAYAAPADQGVALWLPAGAAAVGWAALLRAGPQLWPLELSWENCRNLMRWQRQQTLLHQRAVPVPNHCLLALGVAPGAQGQGLGRQLLRTSLAAVGGRFLPSYAAVHSARALQFVRQQGFEVAAYGPAGAAAGHPSCWGTVRAAGRV